MLITSKVIKLKLSVEKLRVVEFQVEKPFVFTKSGQNRGVIKLKGLIGGFILYS